MCGGCRVMVDIVAEAECVRVWGGCRVTVDIVAEAECVCVVDVGSRWTLLLKLSACAGWM